MPICCPLSPFGFSLWPCCWHSPSGVRECLELPPPVQSASASPEFDFFCTFPDLFFEARVRPFSSLFLFCVSSLCVHCVPRSFFPPPPSPPPDFWPGLKRTGRLCLVSMKCLAFFCSFLSRRLPGPADPVQPSHSLAFPFAGRKVGPPSFLRISLFFGPPSHSPFCVQPRRSLSPPFPFPFSC